MSIYLKSFTRLKGELKSYDFWAFICLSRRQIEIKKAMIFFTIMSFN